MTDYLRPVTFEAKLTAYVMCDHDARVQFAAELRRIAEAMKTWSKEMPDRIGLWEIRCGETDYKPDRVAITLQRGRLIVHDEHLGEIELRRFHNGLTFLEWRFIA